METIEEREDNFVKRELPHNNGTALWRDGYCEGLKVGYHFGAIEQKTIDIDKACEYFADWMRRHNDYAQFAIDGLRKAMEE